VAAEEADHLLRLGRGPTGLGAAGA
jgi:hypothetical protein